MKFANQLLIDNDLYQVSGFDALREIRNDGKLKVLPFVFFASCQEDRDVIEVCGLGTNGYAVNPLDLRLFVEAVKRTAIFQGIINLPPRIMVRANEESDGIQQRWGREQQQMDSANNGVYKGQ